LRGRKNGIHAVFSPFGVFATQKLQAMVTADILSAILPFLGMGFSLRENPGEITRSVEFAQSANSEKPKGAAFWFGIQAGLKQRPPCGFSPFKNWKQPVSALSVPGGTGGPHRGEGEE
jgi:hypothetical protein